MNSIFALHEMHKTIKESELSENVAYLFQNASESYKNALWN